MAASERWYFTKEQLAQSPSRKSGLDADKELSYRQQNANFIQDMGQRLQVTQLCINTAIVYMHRFYTYHSFTKFHRNQVPASLDKTVKQQKLATSKFGESIAVCALFLAAKVEEQPRKLEHVIKVAHICLHRDAPPLDTRSELYLEQAHELVVNENIMLQTLGFDIAIDHPHTYVVKCCQLVRASKDLAQTSYFMATNSLHLTTMCLQYKPTVVACVCIHLVSKWSDWKIPQSSEGKDWFWYIDKTVTTELLEVLTSEFLAILDKCPSRLKKKISLVSSNSANISNSNANSSGSSSSRKDGHPSDKKLRLEAAPAHDKDRSKNRKPHDGDPEARLRQPHTPPLPQDQLRELSSPTKKKGDSHSISIEAYREMQEKRSKQKIHQRPPLMAFPEPETVHVKLLDKEHHLFDPLKLHSGRPDHLVPDSDISNVKRDLDQHLKFENDVHSLHGVSFGRSGGLGVSPPAPLFEGDSSMDSFFLNQADMPASSPFSHAFHSDGQSDSQEGKTEENSIGALMKQKTSPKTFSNYLLPPPPPALPQSIPPPPPPLSPLPPPQPSTTVQAVEPAPVPEAVSQEWNTLNPTAAIEAKLDKTSERRERKERQHKQHRHGSGEKQRNKHSSPMKHKLRSTPEKQPGEKVADKVVSDKSAIDHYAGKHSNNNLVDIHNVEKQERLQEKSTDRLTEVPANESHAVQKNGHDRHSSERHLVVSSGSKHDRHDRKGPDKQSKHSSKQDKHTSDRPDKGSEKELEERNSSKHEKQDRHDKPDKHEKSERHEKLDKHDKQDKRSSEKSERHSEKSGGLKIKISKDKVLHSSSTTDGSSNAPLKALKIKISKNKIAPPVEPNNSHSTPPSTGLKLKITKERLNSGSSSRKRDREKPSPRNTRSPKQRKVANSSSHAVEEMQKPMMDVYMGQIQGQMQGHMQYPVTMPYAPPPQGYFYDSFSHHIPLPPQQLHMGNYQVPSFLGITPPPPPPDPPLPKEPPLPPPPPPPE